MSTSTAVDRLSKDAEIHQAIEAALKNLEAHAGQEGFRQLHDKALHDLATIDQAGFCIVRKRPKRQTWLGHYAVAHWFTSALLGSANVF
jgi:hypothetical protein